VSLQSMSVKQQPAGAVTKGETCRGRDSGPREIVT
jgi:hypothetical protein